jgi:hypothetical protein
LRGLWLRRRRVWNPRCSRPRSNSLGRSGSRARLWGWGGVVDGTVLAGRAGRYGEKFVKGEETGLAAFPAYKGVNRDPVFTFLEADRNFVCTHLFGLRGRLEGRDGRRMARPGP